MSRDASGTPVFDEDIVRRLFGSRTAPVAAMGPSLGTVGSTRLGPAAEPAPSLRETRRREIWRQRRVGAPGQEPGLERLKVG
jgi:hypothetical protein